MKTLNRFITIPITQVDRNIAQKIAAQYDDFSQKQAKVIDDILAVCAVKNYLQILDIPTDINKSYSFKPEYQLIENVADLYLTNIGRLECRPVKPNQNSCYIPSETWSNRIGYIAVEISADHQQAILLGFIQKVTSENLPITYLKPVDTLLEAIAEIELESDLWERLKNWVDQTLETGWQTFDELFQTPQLQYPGPMPSNLIRVKSNLFVLELIETIENPSNEKKRQEAISLLGERGKNSPEAIAILEKTIKTTNNDNTRWQAASSLAKIDPDHRLIVHRTAKLLNLGLDLEGQEIALCINLLPTEEEKQRIRTWVELRSNSPAMKLPPGLKLAIVVDDQTKEISTRSDINGWGIDESIEMRFLFTPGQNFHIKVTFHDKIITEKYMDI
jgi:Protein of unknown function (DUF1822)